jgi:ABC-type uncharacterized transport system substrate-binding protein
MTHRTIGVLVTVALTILVTPLAAQAQPAGRPVTIGYLGNVSPALKADLIDAFREGLRQLGYVEGENLVIRYVWAEGQQERHAALARELVRLQPDLIFTAGAPGTLAAKHATPSIPIVTAIAGDPGCCDAVWPDTTSPVAPAPARAPLASIAFDVRRCIATPYG